MPFDPFAAGLAAEEKEQAKSNGFDPFAGGLADEAPGFFEGTANSARRGWHSAVQSADAAQAVYAAARMDVADETLQAIEDRRKQVPVPRREDFDKYGKHAEGNYKRAMDNYRFTMARYDSEARAEANRRKALEPAIPELVADMAQRQAKIAALPQTAGKQAFDDAEGLGAAVGAVARNPIDSIAGLVAESLPASSPSLALGAAGSLAGPAGTAAGAGTGSFAVEAAAAILQDLQEMPGVDFNNPETVATVLKDPKKRDELLAKAWKRGVPVAAFDAISAGLAGRLLRQPATGVMRKAAGGAAELGIQSALGGAGEAAGGLVAEGKVDAKAVLAEMLGELGHGAGEIATGVVRDRADGVVAPHPSDQTAQATADEHAAAFDPFGSGQADEAPAAGASQPKPATVTPTQRQIDLAAAGREAPEIRVDRAARQARLEQAFNADEWWPGGEPRAGALDERRAAADPAGALREQLAAEQDAADPGDYRNWWEGRLAADERLRQSHAGRDALNTQLANRQVADIAEAIKQRQLSGPEMRPEAAEFARRLTPGEEPGNTPSHGLPQDTESDPFTGLRTDITGGRVSAAQALRVARRVREMVLDHAQPDAGGAPRLAQTQLAVEGRAGLHQTLTHPGRIPLKRIGGGVEASAFADPARGVVYKVYSEGSSGSQGLRLTIDPADGNPVMDTGRDAHIAQKAWVINALGGTPTEIVGYTKQGEVVVKQPLGSAGATWQPWAVNRDARLVEIPEGVLPRHKGMGALYLAHIDGHDFIVGDLHEKNYIGDTLARGRINDLVTRRLAPADLDRSPALRAWIEQNRAEAQAPGPSSFARRTPEQADLERATLESRRAEWRAKADKVAPGLMQRFRLEFGDPSRLVEMGRASRRDITGYEEAAYLARERMFFLFDEALRKNTDAMTLTNLLHEMGHAHWDTLPVERQAELLDLWHDEMMSRKGPLFTRAGELKAGVAMGVENSVKEWYAERLAWANHAWASRRAGTRAGDGLIGRMAQHFRQILERLRDYVQRLRGATDPIDLDFRRFLDQGDRFADRAAPAVVRPGIPQSAFRNPHSAFARRAPLLGSRKDFARNAKAWLRHWFTSAGGMPADAWDAKVAKDGRLASISQQTTFAVRDLDRAVHAVFGGYKPMTEAQLRQLNDVLGGKAGLGTLDPRLQGPIGTMRGHIDVLSRRLVDEGAISGAVAMRVEGNIGFYLHRSYRKFDDPKWARQVPQEVRNRAESFIAAELAAKSPGGKADPREVRGYLEYMLGKDVEGAEAFFSAPSREGAKDLRIFTPRKEIPAELRDLLGEYHDPRINYLRSVAKTAQVIESHAFLQQVAKFGRGKWLFDRPRVDADGSYTVPLAPEGSDAMGPLAGLFTTAEIARAFQAHADPAGSHVWRWWLRLNGWTKLAKTVHSPMTQARNFAGNIGFMVANGHWRADAAADVWQALRADFGWGDTPAARQYLAKLNRLGIVGESVNAGELREALGDAGVRMTGLEPWVDARIKRAISKPFEVAARIYQLNDEIYKIYAFENERRAWAKADPSLAPEQIDKIAAERVRNTIPTYSLIPRAAQAWRRIGLTGSFLSFPAEVMRTSYYTIGYALADLGSTNVRVKAMGAKRLAGIITVATLPAALSMLTRWIAGLDKDDEKDIRRYLAPWNRNADLYYQGDDGKGRYRLIDASYLDPWNSLKKPVTAALNGGDLKQSAVAAGLELMEPFAGEGLLTKLTLDLARNRDERGVQVTNPEADFDDQVGDYITHAWKTFEPGAITQTRRIVKAARGELSETGRAYDLGNEVQAVLTGARSQSLDVAQGLIHKAQRFAGARHDAELLYTRVRDRRGNVAPAEIASAKEKMETARRRIYAAMGEDVAAARRLGVDSGSIVIALKAANVGEDDIAYLITGRYRPYVDNPFKRTRVLQGIIEKR